MQTLLLGAHMSIAGGLWRAIEHIRVVDGTALQIFTRNQRQWAMPPITDETAARFAEGWAQWGDWPVIAHDSYLINLASPEPDKAERSIAAFAEELRRVERLGIPLLVTHPGSHLGQGVGPGIRRYAENLDAALERSETDAAMVLLETTSGQGTNLGSRFEELRDILAASHQPARLGVCLDTCHAFAAGYDLRTAGAVAATVEQLDRVVGLERLRWLHLNDSKTPFASGRDRHEHIGKGEIGVEGFRAIMRHPALSPLPMTLETPKEDDLEDDRINLRLLRQLAGGRGGR
jgi:deoxyribonuclease-4